MGASLKEGSVYPKVAMVVVLVVFLLHLIAMGAPFWSRTNSRYTNRDEHVGLWRHCSYPIGGGQHCTDFINIIEGDWLKVAQAFSILALFALMGTVALVAMVAFAGFDDNPKIMGAAIAVTGVSALFLLIEVGTWGAKHQEYFNNREDSGVWKNVGELYWAFGIACTSMVLDFIAVALLVLEMMRSDDDD